MTEWIETLAAWEHGSTRAMRADPLMVDAVRERARHAAILRVVKMAQEAGAEILEDALNVFLVPTHPAMTDDVLAYGAVEVLLVEARAIKLRNPNPFPEIVLFGRRRMASTLKGLAP